MEELLAGLLITVIKYLTKGTQEGRAGSFGLSQFEKLFLIMTLKAGGRSIRPLQ